MRLYSLVLCVISLRALAGAEVMAVHLSQPLVRITHFPDRRWLVEDHLCVERGGAEIACGRVVESQDGYAIVKITHQPRVITRKSTVNEAQNDIEVEYKSYWPAKGDGVHLINPNPRPDIQRLARELASTREFGGEALLSRQEIKEKEQYKLRPLSILVGGMNWAFPQIHYQQAIAENIATGLSGLYFDYGVANGGLRGFGGMATFNYYPWKHFDGLWWQLGLGAYRLSAYSGQRMVNTWSLTSTATVGYRLIWKDKLSFGLAGGVQYLPNAKPSEFALEFSGIVPSFILDFGIIF